MAFDPEGLLALSAMCCVQTTAALPQIIELTCKSSVSHSLTGLARLPFLTRFCRSVSDDVNTSLMSVGRASRLAINSRHGPSVRSSEVRNISERIYTPLSALYEQKIKRILIPWPATRSVAGPRQN